MFWLRMSNQNFENEVSPLTVRLVNLVEQAEEPYHHQFKPKEEFQTRSKGTFCNFV